MDKRQSLQTDVRQFKTVQTNRYSTLPKKSLPQASAANGGLINVKVWNTIEYAQKALPAMEDSVNASIVGKLLNKRKLEQEASKQTLTVDISQLQLSKNDQRRQEVIYELVLTERDYVNDVQVLCELFISKIKDKKLLSQLNVRKIFSNVEELFGVNQVFYQALFEKRAGAFEQASAAMNDQSLSQEERCKKAADIISQYTMGDVFNLITPYFRSYALYCSNHNDACETLNGILKLAKQNKESTKAIKRKHMSMNHTTKQNHPTKLSAEETEFDLDKQRGKAKEFALYIQYCSFRPECRNLDIFAFLIKPIQRICKYPLLLKEIIKLTPETHPDHALLTKAMTMVEKVVSEVNERGRFHDGQQTRIIELRKNFKYEDASFVGLESKGFDLLGVASRKLMKEQGVKGDVYEVRDIQWFVPGKKMSDGQFATRQLFLFNDCLIYSKMPDKNLFGKVQPQIKVKGVVSLSNVTLVDKVEVEDTPDFQLCSNKVQVYGFRIYVKDLKGKSDGVLCFGLMTAALRDQWFDLVSDAVSEVKKNIEQRANFVFRPSRHSVVSQKHKSNPVEAMPPKVESFVQASPIQKVVEEPTALDPVDESFKLPEVKDGIDLSETVRPYLDQIETGSNHSLDIFGDDVESSKLYRSLTGSKPPKTTPQASVAPPLPKETKQDITITSLDRKDSANSGEKFVNPLALARSGQIFVSTNSIKVSKLEQQPVIDTQKASSLTRLAKPVEQQPEEEPEQTGAKTDSFVVKRMSSKVMALRHSSFMRHKTSLSSQILQDASQNSINSVEGATLARPVASQIAQQVGEDQLPNPTPVPNMESMNIQIIQELNQDLDSSQESKPELISSEQAVEASIVSQTKPSIESDQVQALYQSIAKAPSQELKQVTLVPDNLAKPIDLQPVTEQVQQQGPVKVQQQVDVDKIVEALLDEAEKEEKRPNSVQERREAMQQLQESAKTTLSEVLGRSGTEATVGRVDSQRITKTMSVSSAMELEQITIIETKRLTSAKNSAKRVTVLKDRFEQLSNGSLDDLTVATKLEPLKPQILSPKPKPNTVQEKLRMFEATVQRHNSQAAFVHRTQSSRIAPGSQKKL